MAVSDADTFVRAEQLVIDRLLELARADARIECCGLLAGRGGIISTVLPAENALRSATAYEIAPAQLFALLRRMHVENLDHLGIYHSHPRGENIPSPRDRERAFYPAAAYFIISPLADAQAPVRAFRIRDGQSEELILQVV